jgi:hypothetical protein
MREMKTQVKIDYEDPEEVNQHLQKEDAQMKQEGTIKFGKRKVVSSKKS